MANQDPWAMFPDATPEAQQTPQAIPAPTPQAPAPQAPAPELPAAVDTAQPQQNDPWAGYADTPEAALPVQERQNVVPREPVKSTVDTEGRTISGPSAGVPIGEAADTTPEGYNAPAQPNGVAHPEFLRKGAPEPSAPDTGGENVGEVAQDLPIPSDNMYQGMSYKEANQVYDAYARHPGVEKSLNGSMTYKGKTVYSPDLTFGDLADPNIPIEEKIKKGGFMTPLDPIFPDHVGAFQRAGHSVVDFAKNTGKTLMAAGDVARDYATKMASGTPGVDLTPKEPAKGLETFKKVTQYGGLGEQNLESTSGQVYDSAVEMAVGAALGSKAVNSQDAVKTLIGGIKERAAQGTGVALGTDENSGTAVTGDNAYIQLLHGLKIDPNDPEAEQLLEKKANLVIDAFGVGAVGQSIATPLKYLGSMFKTTIARPIVKATSKEMMKNDETREIIGILADIPHGAPDSVYKEAGTKIQTIIRGNKELNIPIGEKGISDINMPRDPMSAIQRGGDETMAERAGSLKGAAIRTGNSPLEESLKAPEKTLKTLTDQTQEALGGTPAMEQTRKSVVESGKKEIATAKYAVEDVQKGIKDAEEGASAFIKHDPVLGKKLSEVAGETDFDPYRFKNESTDKIVETMKKSYDAMSKKKDEMFGKLDKSINMPDKPSFDSELEHVKEYLSPQTIKAIEDSKGKFAPMFNNVRQMIRNDAQMAYKNHDQNKFSAIMKLHDNIYDHQVEVLAGSEGVKKAATGQAAIDAVAYYKNEYAPIWNQDPTREFAQKYRATIGRKMNENEFAQAGSDIVQGNLKNDSRFMAPQIKAALGDDKEQITDYVMGDVASQVSAKLRGGEKLSDLNVEDIVKPLSEYAATLEKGSPAYTRVQTFLDSFAKHKGNIKEMEGQLDEAVAKSKEVESKVYTKSLKDFMSKEGDTVTENTDPYQALTAMMRDPKRSGDFDNLVARIESSGDPLPKKGLQVAYARYLDEVFQGGEEFNKRAGKGAEHGWNDILEKGKKVFSDKPNIQIAMERMVEEATNANKGTVAKATLDPANSTEAGARYGIGRVITFMLGQLSSRGAKARVIADSMIRRADPTTERKDVFKMLLSDSDYLDEAIEGFKGKREAWLNKEAKAVGRRIMLRAGIKAEGSNDRDLSDAMNDAATPEDNTSEQTKKAFGGSKTERDLPSKSQIGSLKLNPQEEHLYEHHVNNIKNGKFVRNDNGSVSTIFQTSIDIKGKTYNFPTVWDGKILSPHDAADRAIKEKGLDYWPSYKDPTEAETRYSKMHDVMAPDVNSLQNELGTPKE